MDNRLRPFLHDTLGVGAGFALRAALSTAQKSLGRLQPRLVGSLRKCEEEAFAQVTVAYTCRFAIPVLRTSRTNAYNVAKSIEAPRMSNREGS